MRQLPVIEMGLINAARTKEDFDRIDDAGPLFAHYGTAYDIAKNYCVRYDKPAPFDVLRATYEHWEQTEGEFEHWFTEWLPARRVFATRRAMNEAINAFDADPDNPEKAISKLIADVQKVGMFGELEVHSTDAMIGERYEKYRLRTEHRKQAGFKLWGIPTGISAIDATRQGWMPGELIGFYARPTVGKTWMLLREGAIAWISGRKVLLISPEMPPEQIALRLDTLLAGQMGLPLSHARIASGDLSIAEQYHKLAERVYVNQRWWTVSDIAGRAPTVSDIANLHTRYQPDLILIDGISLLADEDNGRQEWERMKHVCYALKRFATFARVAVIASHQSVNSRRGARSNRNAALGRGDDWIMPSLNDAAFGDAFVQAMSTVFTMAPDAELENIRWYSIRKTRERDITFKPRMALGWDVDRGIIVDLGKWNEDMAAIQAELRALGIGLPSDGA